MCRDKLIHYAGQEGRRDCCSAAICKLLEATGRVRSTKVSLGIFYYYCFLSLHQGIRVPRRDTQRLREAVGVWVWKGVRLFCWAQMDSSIQTCKRTAPLMDSSHCDGKVTLLPPASRRLISVKFNGRHCARFPIKPLPMPPP